MKKTDRGFSRKDFKDQYGECCSLQASSLATENCIWFGVDNPRVTILAKEMYPQVADQVRGWVDVPLPKGALVFGRMHLNQEMVKSLLPHLIKFAETGELE